jgi:hypothetical protein
MGILAGWGVSQAVISFAFSATFSVFVYLASANLHKVWHLVFICQFVTHDDDREPYHVSCMLPCLISTRQYVNFHQT